MEYLIDTHCWLWCWESPEKLGADAEKIIRDPKVKVYFSAASAWELAIKVKLGKLKIQESLDSFINSRLKNEAFTSLPIEISHATKAYALPLHHRDPFDRILIAQAYIEDLCFITADSQIKSYSIKILFIP